jgi:hypothetical protein
MLSPSVQISSLLERMNGYNMEQQMLALHNLEREAQEENVSIRQLAEKGSRDSASVRILTIITLIYLPCTVVSVSSPPLRSAKANTSGRASTPLNLLTRRRQSPEL